MIEAYGVEAGEFSICESCVELTVDLFAERAPIYGLMFSCLAIAFPPAHNSPWTLKISC